MAKLAIKKASTDVTTYVFIQDSSKTTGEGLTGLAYNTGSLVGYYVRPKGSATAITLATQTVTGDHSDGGFVEIDATKMPGVYRLDLPDAVCATGVPSVVVMLKGATNMSPVVLEIQLTDFDLNTAAITVDGIADAVWDEAVSGHTTGTTFGGKNQKVVPSETINDYKADVSALTNVTLASSQPAITWGQQKIIADADGEGALDIRNSNEGGIGLFNSGDVAQLNEGGSFGVLNVGGYNDVTGFDPAIATASNLKTVKDNVFDVKAKTDNLPASPAAVGSAMTLTAAYDKAKDDVLTPLGVVDGIVDAIKVQTDKIPASPASAGEYTANIGAIKAKTDNLPLSPASSGEYTSALTAIQNDLDNPNQYKADVSNLALQATSLAIKGQTDKIPAAPAQTGEYNAALTAIQADLDNPTQYKADVSGLATQASVNAIPTTPLLAANYVAPNNAGIADIKAKTDNLPASPAPANEYDAELAALQADLDNADQYKADVSGLATTIHVQEVENKVDLIDVTTVANSGKIDAVDTKVSAIDTDTIMSFMIDGFTFEQIVQIMAAVLAGKLTRSGDTLTFRDLADTVNRVVAETDENKQRTGITYTV